jgi:catechol 2,3-dioxygenase-like lactoylglutathione lyase family enzyme
MLDHISVSVRDYAKSKAFYEKALAPLGITLIMEFGPAGGFGKDGKPFFWIGEGKPDYWKEGHESARSPIHVAFRSPDRPTVDAFYRAALAAGGVDHGAPGIRAHYHPNYYGAFLLDLDGNDIEAVCHAAV